MESMKLSFLEIERLYHIAKLKELDYMDDSSLKEYHDYLLIARVPGSIGSSLEVTHVQETFNITDYSLW